MKKRTPAFCLILALFTVTFCYIPCEIYYRYRTLKKLDSSSAAPGFVESPLYLFDEELGYRYAPNTKIVRGTRFPSGQILSNVFPVNNHGHPSKRDDQFDKAAGEYRIVVLGDSLTAGIDNTEPWPSAFEDKLNADTDLLKLLKAKSFKVINLGMEGTGVEQFATVMAKEGTPVLSLFYGD